MTGQEWFTVSELLALGLAGLPGTRKHALRTLSQGQSRPRASGKGLEYHYTALPEAARNDLLRKLYQAGKALPGFALPPPSPKGPVTLAAIEDHQKAWDAASEFARNEAHRRNAILREFEELRTHGKLKIGAAADWIRDKHDIENTTLWRWRQAVEGRPPECRQYWLLPQHGGGTERMAINSDVWRLIKSDYFRLEAPAASACFERASRVAAKQGWSMPSLKTVLRRLKSEFDPSFHVRMREGVEALERMFPPQERDHSMFDALEAVNADGHKFDTFVRWADGEIGRPVLVGWQDVYSGKLLNYRVGKTETAELVRLSFGDLVRTWGIPRKAWLDNGRAFASKWITGGIENRYRFKVRIEEPVGLLTNLGVKVHWVKPYHGQAKPIERAWLDLCEHVARHPAHAGAYTGNNPNAKPENYASRAVPIDEFMATLDAEVIAHNARRGRRSKVCRGELSLDNAFNAKYERAVIRRASEAEKRMFLLAAEGVSCDKSTGAVELAGNRYWSHELGRYMGQKVVIRFDPQALRQPVHVYTLKGNYICAADCTFAGGFEDIEAGRVMHRAKGKFLKAVKDMVAAEALMTPAEVARAIPAPDKPAVVRPKVVGLDFSRRPSTLAPGEGDPSDDLSWERAQIARMDAIKGGFDPDSN